MSNQQYKDHDHYGEGQYSDSFCIYSDADNGQSDADNGQYQPNLGCAHYENNTGYLMCSKPKRMTAQKDFSKNKSERRFVAGNNPQRVDPEVCHVGESGDYSNRTVLPKYNQQSEDCCIYHIPYCRHQKPLMYTEEQLRKSVVNQKKNALRQSRMNQRPGTYNNITPHIIQAVYPNTARMVNNRQIKIVKACNPKYHCNGPQIFANRKMVNNYLLKSQNNQNNMSESISTGETAILKARYKKLQRKTESKKTLHEACSRRPSTISIFKKNTPKNNEDTKQLYSFIYEAFENSGKKQIEKETENAVEDQYSKCTALNTTQDDEDSAAERQDEDTETEVVSPSREASEERIYTREFPSKKLISHSQRRRGSSARKIVSKPFGDVLKLQRSKSSLISVINDGLQKCEISSKSGRDIHSSSQQSQFNGSQDKSVCSCMKLVNADVISTFVKKTRDYHLQKISEEVKCIKNLEATSQKLLQPDSN